MAVGREEDPEVTEALEDEIRTVLGADSRSFERKDFWREAYMVVLRQTGTNQLAKMAADWAVRDLERFESSGVELPPNAEDAAPDSEPGYLGQR